MEELADLWQLAEQLVAERRPGLRRPGGRPDRLPGLERIHGSRDPELLFRSDRASTRETPMNNSIRGGLVTALTAGALLILPMSNGRVTRAVSRTAGAHVERSEDALRAAAEGILAHGRRVRLHPAGPEDHGQQHHDRRRPQGRRRPLVHRRPRSAPGPQRPDHRGADLDELHPRAVGPLLPQLHGLHHPRADEPDHRRDRHAGRHGHGRDLHRHRPRPRDVQVRQGGSGRLRRHGHDHPRHLRDPQHGGHPGQELLSPTSSRTSCPTARRSPRPGT